MKPVQVSCYSGREYAERPVSFVMDDRSYGIETVMKDWKEPGEKHFLVVADDNNCYELCYNERHNRWFVRHSGEKEPG